MLRIITFGFDKYVSNDINFIRFEDIENIHTWLSDDYTCVFLMADSNEAISSYKSICESEIDFRMGLPLHIFSSSNNIDSVLNCLQLEPFNFHTHFLPKNFMIEDIELVALGYEFEKYVTKYQPENYNKLKLCFVNGEEFMQLDPHSEEFLQLDEYMKSIDFLQAKVKHSEINLKLAQKNHNIILAILNQKNNNLYSPKNKINY